MAYGQNLNSTNLNTFIEKCTTPKKEGSFYTCNCNAKLILPSYEIGQGAATILMNSKLYEHSVHNTKYYNFVLASSDNKSLHDIAISLSKQSEINDLATITFESGRQESATCWIENFANDDMLYDSNHLVGAISISLKIDSSLTNIYRTSDIRSIKIRDLTIGLGTLPTKEPFNAMVYLINNFIKSL